jgi:hypothetical protein
MPTAVVGVVTGSLLFRLGADQEPVVACQGFGGFAIYKLIPLHNFSTHL